MATLTVGLTGGLASGKSTVARQLAKAGFLVVDADQVVHDLYGPGQKGTSSVVDLFGPDLLTSRGAVDKSALAHRVFSDPDARASLEAAIHALVGERFRHAAEATDGVAVLEATKLVEAGLARELDLLVTVEAPLELRLERAERRGLSAAEARRRVAAQGTEAERRARADVVLENAGTVGDLLDRVDRLAIDLRRRADEKRGTGPS